MEELVEEDDIIRLPGMRLLCVLLLPVRVLFGVLLLRLQKYRPMQTTSIAGSYIAAFLQIGAVTLLSSSVGCMYSQLQGVNRIAHLTRLCRNWREQHRFCCSPR